MLVGLTGIGVDEVDVDAQVVFSEQLVLVAPLQPSGTVVGTEPLCVEGVGEELGFEGNVRESVAVLDLADEAGPLLLLLSVFLFL